MCPGFDSWTRRHMWVEFVIGSLLCSERFFSGYSGFPLSPKTNISKFQFHPDAGPPWKPLRVEWSFLGKYHDWMVIDWMVITLSSKERWKSAHNQVHCAWWHYVKIFAGRARETLVCVGLFRSLRLLFKCQACRKGRTSLSSFQTYLKQFNPFPAWSAVVDIIKGIIISSFPYFANLVNMTEPSFTIFSTVTVVTFTPLADFYSFFPAFLCNGQWYLP